MKKIALAAAISAYASTAFAGNLMEPMPEPEVEPVVIEEDTSGTGAAWVIPVLLLAVIGAAAAN